MKKRVGAVVSLGLVALLGMRNDPLPEVCRPIKYADSLAVRPNGQYRYVSKLSEEQAYRNLTKLTAVSTPEDLWLHLPQHSLWIDVGISLSHAQVRYDVDCARRLMVQERVVETIHNHPGTVAVPSVSDLSSSLVDDVYHRKRKNAPAMRHRIIGHFNNSIMHVQGEYTEELHLAAVRLDTSVLNPWARSKQTQLTTLLNANGRKGGVYTVHGYPSVRLQYTDSVKK